MWRGRATRKLSSENSARSILLRWRWGSKGLNDVYIAGDFSGWEKWKMTFCLGHSEHRLSIPLHILKGVRGFRYKFVVDGLWTCDGSLTMEEDEAGNMNNVYEMSPPDVPQRVNNHTQEIFSKVFQTNSPSPAFQAVLTQPATKQSTSRSLFSNPHQRLPPPSGAARGT